MAKSQINKVLSVLSSKGQKTPGLTVPMIAKSANMPAGNVAKRVSDLRSEGYTIYTNYRNVNGERKTYYRMAG